MELTRRRALAGAAVVAATPLLSSMPGKAAAPVADKQAPSFYRYKVGDIQVTVVSDGRNTGASQCCPAGKLNHCGSSWFCLFFQKPGCEQ